MFPLSPIKQIELAASKIPGAVSLAQGIPSFNLHPEILAFVEERIRAGVCDRYSLTNGLQELREEISLSLAADGMHYDPDSEIICTVGSIQAISAALLAITTPGDEVLILSPTYTSYQGVIAMARCSPKFISLNEEKNFDIDIDAIEAAVTSRTKVIFYCNPNNPTGTIFSGEAIRRLAELAERKNLLILADEVYKDFYYVDLPHETPARFPEIRERVVRVFSFSKAFSMTGWRIGFLHSSEIIVKKILPYHDAMVTCAPVVSQYAAIAALRSGDRIVSEYREEFRRRRDYTLQCLDRVSDLIDYQIPTASYFVFPRLKHTLPNSTDSVAFCYDMLTKVKLAVVPGSAFGPSGEGHVRISFGRDFEVLQEGLSRFESYLRDSVKTRHHAIQPIPKQRRRGFFSSLGVKLLGRAAKFYLERNPVRVIGIAGARGKTVFKRVLADELGKGFRTRGGILSYNTEVGLPLSILNTPLPERGILSRLRTIIRASLQALSGREHSEILILEYGARSAEDAQELLTIVVPDYLVITELATGESGGELLGLSKGVERIAAAVSPGNILWVDSGSLPDSLRQTLLPSNKLTSPCSSKRPSASYRLAESAVEKLHSMLKSQAKPPYAPSRR
jgi:aminotransferase